jgi:hypothetical protein
MQPADPLGAQFCGRPFHALCEQVVFDQNGKTLNPSFVDYLMPTINIGFFSASDRGTELFCCMLLGRRVKPRQELDLARRGISEV